MNIFNVGDKVVRICEHHSIFGNVYEVEEVIPEVNKIKLKGIRGSFYAPHFQLVEKFDMKTRPWFIRVNSEEEFLVTELWLKETLGKNLGYQWKHMCDVCDKSPKLITNTLSDGTPSDRISWTSAINTDCFEIKLTTKILIDCIEWRPAKTEMDLKIEELEKTIADAQKQLQELKKV